MAVLRGMCSLWIVYFHTLTSYLTYPLPGLHGDFFTNSFERFQAMGLNAWESALVLTHDVWAFMSMSAVGAFIMLSGFGLTRSAMRECEMHGGIHWKIWAGKRFWRLYPFLWFAHLIFLFAPWIAQAEPIDYRFLVSLAGIRAYPMEMIIFYANPSWWFFWLILQLYLVYPLILWVFRRTNPWVFLVLMLGLTIFGRWLILFVWEDWRGMIIGGFFIARLGEFVLGMGLAALYRAAPEKFTARLTGWKTFLAGCIVYPLGVMCYANLTSYLFVDILCALGFVMLMSPVAKLVADHMGWLAAGLAFAGSVSLSTFLLHQPWTTTAGNAMQGWPWWQYGLITLLILPLMVVIAWACEWFVAWVVSFLRRPRRNRQ